MRKKLFISILTMAMAVATMFAQTTMACEYWFISPQRKCPKSLL